MSAIYRASTLKRVRRSKSQRDQLDQQIIDVLKEDHPQSVRHVFYRMTDPRLPEPVEKSDRGYRHVQERCVKLRRAGLVPYNWFADLSRRGYFVNTYDDASDFITRMQGQYRADLWRNAEVRCEIWAESRSIASVLLDDCNDMAVDLYPCCGFASLSFIHEAASYHNAIADRRPLQVFYIGDYDPAGVLIDVSLQRELREHLRSDVDLVFERIGINTDQIEAFDLPTKPRKASDKRSMQVDYSVEAEAMPASILRGILRLRVEALLPEHALEVAKVAEESERAHLAYMSTISEVLRRGSYLARLVVRGLVGRQCFMIPAAGHSANGNDNEPAIASWQGEGKSAPTKTAPRAANAGIQSAQ